MKTTYIKLLSMLIFIAGMNMGCKKLQDFGDINTDQSKVEAPNTRALFTYALQKGMARDTANTAATTTLSIPGAIMGQYLSEGPYLTYTPFSNPASQVNASYYSFYAEILKNLNQIISYNQSNAPEAEPFSNGSKNNQIAAARIYKAYIFWRLTDRWGDLPYFEALKGNENITPAFTKQEEIYKDLFKELKEAAAQIDQGKGIEGDVLFNGDMNGWKKFAATQRLIMALRMSKVYPAAGDLAAQEFIQAMAAGPIAANSTITYKFLANDPNNFNPWYTNYMVKNRNDYAVSKTLIELMRNNASGDDPRIKVFAETLPNGSIVGLTFGITTQTSIPNAYSRINPEIRAAGSPAYVFTGAQVQFALAEAAKRGWIPGGDAQAEQYYNAGIDASLAQYGVPNPAFKEVAGIKYNAATAFKQIGEQRWLATYLDGWEGWTEFRRTGYPALVPGPNSQNGNVIPRRIGYPTSDETTNGANYHAALSQQGWANNSINNRMWWDKP